MVPPKSWYPHCSGGNLPPTGRKAGIVVRLYPHRPTGPVPGGAGWRWVNAATLRVPLYVTGVAAAICRHPAARPESWYVCFCIDQRSQPLAGAGVAMNHRRYIACTVVRNGCSGGNLPPSGRKAGTVVRLFLYRPTGPAPGGAGVAMNHRRYIACTVVRNGCSGGNLPPIGRKAGIVVRLYPHRPTGPAPGGAGVAMNHRRYIACTVVRNECSGGKSAAIRPQGRNRGTFVYASTNGASPWRGWMALGQRRYIAWFSAVRFLKAGPQPVGPGGGWWG